MPQLTREHIRTMPLSDLRSLVEDVLALAPEWTAILHGMLEGIEEAEREDHPIIVAALEEKDRG